MVFFTDKHADDEREGGHTPRPLREKVALVEGSHRALDQFLQKTWLGAVPIRCRNREDLVSGLSLSHRRLVGRGEAAYKEHVFTAARPFKEPFGPDTEQFYGPRPTKPDGPASSEALKQHKSAVSKQGHKMRRERRYFEATGAHGLPGLLALQLPITWFRNKRNLCEVEHIREVLLRHSSQFPGLHAVLIECKFSKSTLDQAEKEGRLIRAPDAVPGGTKPYLSGLRKGAKVIQEALFASMWGSGEDSGLADFQALCAAQEDGRYSAVLLFTKSLGLELGRADRRVRWLAHRVFNHLFRNSLWEKVSGIQV